MVPDRNMIRQISSNLCQIGRNQAINWISYNSILWQRGVCEQGSDLTTRKVIDSESIFPKVVVNSCGGEVIRLVKYSGDYGKMEGGGGLWDYACEILNVWTVDVVYH